MFYIKQNESAPSRRRVPVYLVDGTDGFTPETGITGPTIELSKLGGAQAAGTGTFAETGDGVYYYQFAASEVDTLGWINLRVAAAGCREYQAIVHIPAYDAYDGAGMGLSRLDAAITDRTVPTAEYATAASLAAIVARLAVLLPTSGAVVAGVAGPSVFTANTPQIINDFWNGALLIMTSGANSGVGRVVMDYVGYANGASLFTFYDAFPATPVEGDTFYLCPLTAGVELALRAFGDVQWYAGKTLSDWFNALAGSAAAKPIGMDNGFTPATDSLEAIRNNQGTVDNEAIAAAVDAQLSETHGSGPWGAAGAGGANTVVFTVRDADTGETIEGALVTVKSTGGTIRDQQRTNSEGEAEFSLDSASYLRSVRASGYSSIADEPFTVSGNTTADLEVTAIDLGASDSPEKCRVYFQLDLPNGDPAAGVQVSFRLASRSAVLAAERILQGTAEVRVTSDHTGAGYADLYKSTALEPLVEGESTAYQASCGPCRISGLITVPDVANANLATLLLEGAGG